MDKCRGCTCGYCNTIFLTDEGQVYTCGSYTNGQEVLFSRGLTHMSTLPIITHIASGGEFVLCLDENGKVWSFGDNSYSQLGYSYYKKNPEPKMIENIPIIDKIICGVYHSIIVTEDGVLWSFGSNNYGELCLENTGQAKKPTETKWNEILSVSAGWGFTMFLREDGYIYGCGKNEHYQLGVEPPTLQLIAVKIPIPDITNRNIKFSCACDHTLFLDEDEGKVYTLGNNAYGQSCRPKNTTTSILYEIPDIPKIVCISTGGWHSTCLDEFGSLWVFGYNLNGQLGVHYRKDQFAPVKFPVPNPVVNISRGFGKHTIVKCDNNEIWVSGAADNGQLGDVVPENVDSCIKPECSSFDAALFGSHYKSNVKSARK